MADDGTNEPESGQDGEPDVGFTLSGPGSAAASTGGDSTEPEPEAVLRSVVAAVVEAGPEGWQQCEAVFAVASSQAAGELLYTLGDRAARVLPSEELLRRVRALRELSTGQDNGPWWRVLLSVSADGEASTDYDYGDEPFPEGQLFAPEAYRADLAEYPRDHVPVWLAAYVGHQDRQLRSVQDAAAQARADRASGVWPEVMENEFPDFPVMWARWAVMSAVFVGVGSQWGPRVLPSLGWFESSRRGGCTLYSLPGGRAVLSGGVWDAPELERVYNDGESMPAFFSGAPEWVAAPVLNPRASSGLMSFTYWWEGGQWYRGESPGAADTATAVPGVWTADTVVDVVTGLLAERTGGEVSDQVRDAVTLLVSAAEAGVVVGERLVDVFAAVADESDDDEDEDEDFDLDDEDESDFDDLDEGVEGFDVDGALYQLSLAGLLSATPGPMPSGRAIDRVRTYIESRGLDTTGYPLDELVADRLSVGWMVYVPVPAGEIAIGRAIFYVADDGVLEPSSSSVAPSVFIEGFERRFHKRQGSYASAGFDED